jgi:hypothetical protein
VYRARPSNTGCSRPPAPKLTRLALARSGAYPAEAVLAAAHTAYGPDCSYHAGSYHAHDALPCALVHPDIDATVLTIGYGQHTAGQRGHRSRAKIHRILAWTQRTGYLHGPHLIFPATVRLLGGIR